MPKQKLIITSLINSLIAVLYVSGVAILMNSGEKFFGKTVGVAGAIAILLLFVISATVMGFLILGRPILMYLDGLKKEALKLFYFTIAWLAIIVAIIFISIAIL